MWSGVGDGWMEWSGYPLDCYDYQSTCGDKDKPSMTDFIQLGNQLSAPRPLSFASKWPLTTPLKWFTTNWSLQRLVTLAPPAANTKNVAATATAVPPHTIYCEGLIQT